MRNNLVTGRVIIVNNMLFDANLRRILMLMMQYAKTNNVTRMVSDPSGTERVAFGMAKMLACYDGGAMADEMELLKQNSEVGEEGRFTECVMDTTNHWAFREVEARAASTVEDGVWADEHSDGFFELTFVGCNRFACQAMTAFLGTFGNFIDWNESAILAIQEQADQFTIAMYDDVVPRIASEYDAANLDRMLVTYNTWCGR